MFKLAGHLGKTVAELSDTLSISELKEWQVFDRLDPIGGHRGDLQAAMIALMQSSNPDAKLTDFLVVDPNPMTDEQREVYEEQMLMIELQQSAQRTISMFEHIEAKKER